MAMDRSNPTIKQRNVRRFGASLGLIALALLVSRYVTPSGASSPLVLLGATAAVAYFGGRWPALLATATAAIVNGFGIGLEDVPRLAVESTMIVFLGSLLSFRVPVEAKDPSETEGPVPVEATLSRVSDSENTVEMNVPSPDKKLTTAIQAPVETNTKETRQRPVAPAPTETPTSTSILIVHGNAVLRLALRSTLAGLGYAVRDVANISHAASLLASEGFDGVVLEIGRVDDASLSAIERLHGVASSAGPKECTLFVLAGVENDDDRELLQAAGADFVLGKPVDTAAVAAKVQEQFPTPEAIVQSRVGLGASP
jgi:CheY-like chemotaxis protein